MHCCDEVAMQRKLTITVADDVYRGLHQQIGRGEISRFIEALVRSHVVATDDLEAEYREAAKDTAEEDAAYDWIEAGLDEALD
jgi:predicted CopG family antitoxin